MHSRSFTHTHTHMQICAYAYFVIVFWRVYGKLHSPFSCCCFCYCCWHLRQQLQHQQQAAAKRFSKNRIDRFEKIYKIKCGATTTTTWRKAESIYGISAVPEGLTTRRVCVYGERHRQRRRPPCGGLTISPHPHHRVHCSRAIHLVIAHPTCRGGASASVAHWGIARLSQQLLLLFCCCCCFSFKQNSPPCYAAKAQIFCDCIYREIKSKQVERSRRFCS